MLFISCVICQISIYIHIYVCTSFSLVHPLISIPISLSLSIIFPFVFKVHSNLTLTFFHTLEKRWASYTVQCVGAASFNNHTHSQTNFCMCMWVLNCTHLFWQDFRLEWNHIYNTHYRHIQTTEMSKKWSKHPIMNQISLHKSNVIDAYWVTIKPNRITQTGLIKREMNDRIIRSAYQNMFNSYVLWVYITLADIFVCWCAPIILLPLTHIVVFTQYSFYVILIPSKINTHKCKRTNKQHSCSCKCKIPENKKSDFEGKRRDWKKLWWKCNGRFSTHRRIITAWKKLFLFGCRNTMQNAASHSTLDDKPMVVQIIFCSLSLSLVHSVTRSFTYCIFYHHKSEI